MRKLMSGLVVAALFGSPVHAAAWQGPDSVRPGAFVGFRLQLGGHRAHQAPRLSLAVAPTQDRVGADGMLRTRIGEGVAFNLSAGTKPTVTLAGVRADTAFRMQPGGTIEADRKSGVSTAGWIAIGVGVAALAGGLYFVHLVREADRNSD